MDAWETLISYSSAVPGSDAWTHFNSITGGGPGGTLVLADGLQIEMADTCFDVEIDTAEVEAVVESTEIEVEVEEPEYTVEICDGD